MTKRQVNILLGVLATIAVAGVLLVAGGAWFALSVLHRQDADEQAAAAAFDAARAPFRGTAPVFELRREGPALTRPVPATARDAALHTLHILNWNPDDQSLTRADLPFALLRLTDGPIDVVPYANVMRRRHRLPAGVSVEVADIERFGPAVLLDQELEDGSRVLIWTE